jgi:hypothetical protein
MEIKWHLNDEDADEGRVGGSARVSGFVLTTEHLSGEWLANVELDFDRPVGDTRDEAQALAEAKLRELVAPFVAEAISAERAAIRAEVKRRRADRRARFEVTGKDETLGEELALHRLLAWLDARSKGECR